MRSLSSPRRGAGRAAAAPPLRRAPFRCPLAPCAASPADDARGYTPYADASSHELDAMLAALASRRATSPSPPPVGRVHLVGTGPGDPALLTLGALRLMQSADVVLYDRLVAPEILELVSPSARMVYVGKAAGFHTRTQAEIEALLQVFAHAGARVVRLKGGDPFVFGRGGEEAAALRSSGVAVAVQPGVTAAAGIAAELGVPLTHRGVATSVRFLTGHEKGDGAPVFANSDVSSTLVIYMGLATLPSLVASLVAAGVGPSTPALAVERGTTVGQRRVFARLGALHHGVAAAGLQSPTLLIVGHCVALSPLWPAFEEISSSGSGDDAQSTSSRGWELQVGSPNQDMAAQDGLPSTVGLPGFRNGRVALSQRSPVRDSRVETLSPWR